MTDTVSTVSADEAVRRRYDVVIVGGGWSGSLVAKELGDLGWNVLILEAGNGGTETWPGYLGSLSTYHPPSPRSPTRPTGAASRRPIRTSSTSRRSATRSRGSRSSPRTATSSRTAASRTAPTT
ncbi:hypothetical protein ACFQ0M_47180 [Kitasatospora aburaviensis]